MSLHDVLDVEALAGNIIRRSGLELSHHEHEDLLTDLITKAWILSTTFDPSKRKGKRKDFAGFLTISLRTQIAEWQRQRHGRTKWQFKDRVYERKLPSFVSLDNRRDGPDDGLLDHADASGLQDLLGLQRARGSKGDGSTEEADRPPDAVAA